MNSFFGGKIMHEEYNIMDLKPRKNPYVKTCKKQVTINLDENVITYFKNLKVIRKYLCTICCLEMKSLKRTSKTKKFTVNRLKKIKN